MVVLTLQAGVAPQHRNETMLIIQGKCLSGREQLTLLSGHREN